MQINVTVDGLDGIDLTAEVGTVVVYCDPITEETETRPRTLGDLVAEKLADKLFAETGYENRRALIKEANREVTSIIREKAEPVITAALTGPIRLTNTFGEPTGPETTLNALIIDEAKKVVGGNRTDHGRGQTLAQRLVADAVGAAFTGELSKVLADEKTKVVAAMRAKAAELISESVKQGLGR